MPYSATYQAAADTPFHQQFTVALCKAARQIASEAGATTFHAQRVALVTKVIASPDGMARQLAASAMEYHENQNANLTPTDAQLDAVCSALWNAWSGGYN